MSSIAELISRLETAPSRFTAVLSRLEAADSVEVTRAGEWSAAEVLAHVRASQDIMEPRVLAILARDNPPIMRYDDTRWMQVGRYLHVPVTEALESMKLRRREFVAVLRSLTADGWKRSGQHEVRGALTVLDIATHIAEHEDEHLAQVARSATAYADANVENS